MRVATLERPSHCWQCQRAAESNGAASSCCPELMCGHAASHTRESCCHSERAERHRRRPRANSPLRGSASCARSYDVSASCHRPSFSSHESFTVKSCRCWAYLPRVAKGRGRVRRHVSVESCGAAART